MANEKIKVYIIESERGWGSKLDEIKTFDTEEDANAFVKEYNSGNSLPTVPEWYMYATRTLPYGTSVPA